MQQIRKNESKEKTASKNDKGSITMEKIIKYSKDFNIERIL